MKNFFFGYYQNFLYFTPILLIFGPFVSDLLVSISCLFFFVIFSKINKEFKDLKKIILFIIIFWLLFITNSLLNENILTSLKSSFFSIRFLIFSLIVFYFFSKNDLHVLKFNKVLRYVIIFLCVDALFQYLVGFNFLGFEKQNRLSGIFGDEWVLGSFLSKAFALSTTLSFYKKDEENTKSNLFINIFLLIIVYTTVVLTFERAAFIFLNLYILSIFIFIKSYRKYIILLLGFILLLNFLFLSNLNYYKDRFVKNFLLEIDIKKTNYFLLKDYSDMFLTSYEIFKNNKVTGVGNKNFINECKKYLDKYPKGCSNHPHNYYAQMMSENGISGLTFISLAFLYYFFLLIKILTLNEFGYKSFFISSCITLILILQPLTTTGNFFNNWNMTIISLIFGFSLLKKKIESNM